VLAQEDAVVAHEDDQRVVAHSARFQVAHQATDLAVEGGDHRVVVRDFELHAGGPGLHEPLVAEAFALGAGLLE
jgi:hypothetical protein